jgi:alpha-L-fucosidase
VISRGGNFLLDVGPQPDGQIQPEFSERLKAMGQWVHKNAAAIYDSGYGPIQNESQFRTTSRGSNTYVFVMDATATEISLGALQRPVGQVRLTSTGKPIKFSTSAEGVRIPLTKELWSDGIPVLEVLG